MTKSWLFLRIIAGGYLAYMGGGLVKDALMERPDSYVLYTSIGLVFVALGLWWSVRGVLMAVRHEYIEPGEEVFDPEEEPVKEITEEKEEDE